jgi:putative transposase
VCIVCCDGRKGLPEAIIATWPAATVQTCVVHLVRSTLRFASKAHWAKVTPQLREVYTAPTLAAAEILYLTVRERRPNRANPPDRSTTGNQSSTPLR